jgi:hypothetical protein
MGADLGIRVQKGVRWVALAALILAVPHQGEAAGCAGPSFGAATFGVGKAPQAAAVGDANGDGHLDLAVANSGDNTAAVLNGCGTTPMATLTPTSPPSTTATPTGNPCVGDCDGSGDVSINELISLVTIALGNAQSSACPHGVPSGAEVDIALIIQAVNNALNGTVSGSCSFTSTLSFTPTVTPTRTATSTPTATLPPATSLSAGDAALVAFTTKGTQNDQFAFILLKPVGAQTEINISDENWDGTEFGTSDGAMITWVSDKPYPAGTLVQVLNTSDGSDVSTHSYAVNIYSEGQTFTNVTGPGSQTGSYAFDPASPIQVTTVANTGGGLTGWSMGDQFFLFQGPANLAETAAGVTFISALTYDTAWLTGTPTPTLAIGADTYLPSGLTNGINAMALTVSVGNGGVYNCAVTSDTPANLSAALNNPANWSLAPSWRDLPLPALSCAISVQ